MFRKVTAFLIAFTPFNSLRVFFYRNLLGYRIAPGCRIGMFNYINVDYCSIGRAAIGILNFIEVNELVLEDGARLSRLNRFKMFKQMRLGSGSVILSNNIFFGTRRGISPFKDHENVTVGKDCIITNGHLFDLSDSINLGDNVTVGGAGCQFWTHSFGLNHIKMQAPITIGDDVYFGARCIMTPGVSIVGGVSIGAGTIVSKSILEPGFYVSSCLLRKGEVTDYSTESLVTHNGARFFRRARSHEGLKGKKQ